MSAQELATAFLERFEDHAEEASAIKAEQDKVRYEAFKASVKALVPSQKKVAALAAKIPKFWVTSMLNCTRLAASIPQIDHELLEALTDVQVEHKEDVRSFDIVFTFAENPYFTNKTLTKSFNVEPPVGTEAEPTSAYNLSAPVYMSASDKINWKSGKNLVEIAPLVDVDNLKEGDDLDYDEEKGFGTFFLLFDKTGEDEEDIGETLVEWRSHAIEYFLDSDADDEDWSDEGSEDEE